MFVEFSVSAAKRFEIAEKLFQTFQDFNSVFSQFIWWCNLNITVLFQSIFLLLKLLIVTGFI